MKDVYSDILKILLKGGAVEVIVVDSEREDDYRHNRIRVITPKSCEFIFFDRSDIAFGKSCFVSENKHGDISKVRSSKKIIERMKEFDLGRGLTIKQVTRL